MRKRRINQSIQGTKRMKYFGDPVKDEKVTSLYNLIKTRLKKGYHSFLFNIDDAENKSTVLEVILYILSKPLRNPNDIFILKIYLSALEEFKRLFYTKEDSSNYDELMTRIALHLKYERANENKLLFKFGDKGDKYYIILNGKIAILIPHEEEIHLSLIDYIKYLIVLYLHRENDIMTKVISLNLNVYHLREDDILKLFDLFLTLREVNKRKTDSEYYMILREKLTSDKYVNLNNRSEIQNILFTKLVGNILLTYLSKTELYILYKYFSDKIETIESTNATIISKEEVEVPVIENISVDTYMSELFPQNLNSNQFDPKVKCYKYNLVTILETGANFGDIALQNSVQKRTATVILLEDCHFGTLSKSIYEMCLKNAKNKLRYKSINYFLNGPLFKSISSVVFEVKIFNYFLNEEFKKNSILFQKGEQMQKIYFIKEGEVELYTKTTLNEINDIIISLGGKGDRKLLEHNSIMERVKNQKFTFRIGVLKHNEIVGLNDYINPKTGNYFCNCEVSTSKLEVFSLEKHFLNMLIKDTTINKNVKEFESIKKNIIIKRLISLYNQYKQQNLTLINSHSESSINPLKKENKSILQVTKTSKIRCTSYDSMNLSKENNTSSYKDIKKKIRYTLLNHISKSRAIQSPIESYSSRHHHDNTEYLQNVIKSSIVFNKSFKTKRILLSKKDIVIPNTKTKKKILNELRIKYTKRNPYYTDRNFYLTPRSEKEKEEYEEKFNKLIQRTLSPKVDKRKVENKFIDMLMMDRWNETEMKYNTEKEIKPKKHFRYKTIYK